MSKIEAVIFDAGGVLHESNTAVTGDLIQELGLDRETLKKIWANQISLLGSGMIDEAGLWEQVGQEYGIRQVSVSENLLGRAFKESLKPYTQMSEFIRELGASGMTLAVLSNTIEPHARALKEAGLYDGFDYLFLSHEIGMRKPDPAIYEYALALLGANPEATVFVDDDAVNVEAAEAVGINGVVFTNVEEAISEVRSLIQVR